MKLLLTLILGFFIVFSTFAANDKYRLIITDDPSTTMTIGWNQISGHSVAVFYDVVDHGQDVSSYANFQLPDRNVAYKSMNNHFVRLTGLKPSTAYYFVVVDNEGVSDRFWFRTMSDDPNVPVSIVAGGDSRRSGSQTTPHEPRIKSNLVVQALRPDFVAFGGDYTDKDTDGQWMTWMDDWQYTTGYDGRMIPILPTRGNHERNNNVMKNLFDVQQDDIYYAINFGGDLIRFYTLNVMISVAGNQSTWLQRDLEENKDATAWKFAQYHYSIAPHHSGKSFQTAMYIHWAQLFHQYGMQLVVECDAHVCKNTHPIRPTGEVGNDAGFIRDDSTGTVYCGEGSWGLIRNADQGYEWTQDRGSFTQVKWLIVNKDSVVMQTIKSATSNAIAPVSDDNRFELPQGLDVWVMKDGADKVVLRNPNPAYEGNVTSIDEIVKKENVFVDRLYPNPSSDEIFIDVKHSGLQYAIYGMNGQLVQQGRFNEIKNMLTVESLESGVYKLRVWNGDVSNSEIRTFIKE
jgi:hypothetical protein